MEFKGYPGLEVWRHNMNNLRTTDDSVLSAENKQTYNCC